MIILSILLAIFPVIGDTIPDGPFSYPGQNPREIITVDPDASPLLDISYNDLKQELKGALTEKEILILTHNFVRERVFDLKKCQFLSFQEMIGIEISLEHFLKEKIGVCRHFALVTSLLLHRLIQEKILIGKVVFIRENLPYGRHAWCLYLSENGVWHIDTYWNIFENPECDKGFFRLCQIYGKKAMEKQKLRW